MKPLLIVCALPSPGLSPISLPLPFSLVLGVGRFPLRFFDGEAFFSISATTEKGCISPGLKFVGESGGDDGREQGGGTDDLMIRNSGVVGDVSA